ncbi:MAG: hypothetical protein IT445_07435 [Phycisphaeraceae bacterium]|nr:hypothetical protein [Phycisphaeraceae bacterium]
MTNDHTHQCEYRKDDGTPCRAAAMHGSAYCFFHDPAQTEKRQEARRTGGRERCRPATVVEPIGDDGPLDRVQDVAGLLAETIHQVRGGKLEPRIANAVGYLASTLLKALQAGELEQRLEQLERLMQHPHEQLELPFPDLSDPPDMEDSHL